MADIEALSQNLWILVILIYFFGISLSIFASFSSFDKGRGWANVVHAKEHGLLVPLWRGTTYGTTRLVFFHHDLHKFVSR